MMIQLNREVLQQRRCEHQEWLPTLVGRDGRVRQYKQVSYPSTLGVGGTTTHGCRFPLGRP
jgi:hypothetical protein